ncbi:MAG: HU family DNA-binding protein [Candidatus Rickettsia vulgarisii]
MVTITKERIANMLKSQLGLSAVICKEIVEQFFKNIQEISKDQKLTIPSFGNFRTIIKKSRPGINFHTKETMTIPEKEVMRFVPSKN